MYFFYSKLQKNISKFQYLFRFLILGGFILFLPVKSAAGVHFGIAGGAKSSVLEIPKNFSDLKSQHPSPSFFGGAYFVIDLGKYFYTNLGVNVSNIELKFEQEAHVNEPAKFHTEYTNIQAPISLGIKLFPLKVVNWNFFGGVTFNFDQEQKETQGSIGNIKVPTNLHPSYLSYHAGTSIKIGPVILGGSFEQAVTSYVSMADSKIGNRALNFFVKIQFF